MTINKVFFITYDAYGDWLSCNGLIRYFSKIYDKIFLVLDYSKENKSYPRLAFVKDLFKDDPNIKIIKRYKFELKSKFNLLRDFDVIDVRYHDHFKPIGNRFRYYFSKNNKFRQEFFNYYDNASGFYACLGLDPKLRLNNFFYKIKNQLKEPSNKYSVFCEMYDGQIKKKYIDKKNYHYINLHNYHYNYLELVNIIVNAEKIILIENSIALLIYYLQSSKLIPILNIELHVYARNEKERRVKNSKDSNIYIDMFKNPKLDNWNFIYE